MTGKNNGPIEHEGLTARLQAHLPVARALAQSLPGLDGLELYLIDPDFPQHALSPEEMSAALNYPAYWAFCWASGLVLAQRLLENPGLAAGKRVLDFGCGSGVVGIAAARAGAAEVVACDIDPDALAASAANANLNGESLTLRDDFAACTGEFDLVLAADVLYDRANLPWLDRFLERAPAVLLADSRIRDFQHSRYRKLGKWDGNTWPDLDESPEFRTVCIYSAGDLEGFG